MAHDAGPSSVRREVLVDERGVALRASWHPVRSTVVLSSWHGGVCTGSVRLSLADAGRLASFLLGVLAERASSPPAAPVPSPPTGVLSPAPAGVLSPGRWRHLAERLRRAIA